MARPSPTSPRLNDIASMNPFSRKAQHTREGSEAPLSSLDPDTSQLLPEQTGQRIHHVWIQGRLAPVKQAFVPRTTKLASKSSVLLVPSSPGSPRSASSGGDSRFGDAAATGRTRRRSFDDAKLGGDEDGNEDEDDNEDEYSGVKEQPRAASRSSSQLRGYGIGGAGNIRRPTDVIHGPTKPRHYVRGTDSPQSASSESTDADAPSRLRRMLGLVPDQYRKS